MTRVACVCHVVNLLTTYPYKSSPTWAMVHSWTAISLALVEFAGGVLLLCSVARSAQRLVASALLVVGFSCLVLTYVGRLHVLFAAEVTTAAGFGLALVVAVRALPGTSAAAAAPTTP